MNPAKVVTHLSGATRGEQSPELRWNLRCLTIPILLLSYLPGNSQTPVHTNRLIHEKSPYLLQHAHNPVDWRPWGQEAFDEARKRNRPIFLSIGYSPCHWCHVMERESFENEAIAAFLNETFICIKGVREERR